MRGERRLRCSQGELAGRGGVGRTRYPTPMLCSKRLCVAPVYTCAAVAEDRLQKKRRIAHSLEAADAAPSTRVS